MAALLLAACGSNEDEVAVGQISVGDSGATSDGGSLGDSVAADGAPLADGAGVAGTKDGGGTTGTTDGGGTTGTKDGGGTTGKKDGGGTSGTKDGGGTTGKKDGGGTSGTKDGGGTTGTKDAGPIDTAGDKDKKYQTCPVMLQCATIACDLDPKPGCEKLCTDQATSTLKTTFAPFAKCMWGECMPGCKGAADAKKCSDGCFGQCLSLIYPCYAGGVVGKDDCSEGWSCISDCQEKKDIDVIACNAACYGEMSATGQKQYDAFAQCLGKGEGENIFAGCIQPLLVCAADGDVGKETCPELAACTQLCSKGGDDGGACLYKCLHKGTKKTAEAFLKILICSDKKKAEPKSCLEPMLACVKPTGKSSCLGIWPCLGQCNNAGGDGGVCYYQCLEKATPEAAKAFLTLQFCNDLKCKPDCDKKPPAEQGACNNACQKDKCKAELLGCL